MSNQEIDDYEADNLSDTSRMVHELPPYNMNDQLLPLERRSTCACWAWTFLVVAMNSLIIFLNFLLMAAIFSIILLPTIVVVYFGFQCHSRVSSLFPHTEPPAWETSIWKVQMYRVIEK